MAPPAADRGQWTSRIGFVLAAAGSAIGLGNIWRFPYVAGESGGAAFVVVYLGFIVLICVPYLFAELAIGRFSQKNPVGAIKAIKAGTPWTLVGALCVLTGVCILSYYGVVAGWAFGYVFKSLFSPATEFGTFISSPGVVIPFFAVFMLLTVLVVYGGIEHGIERWTKILMPILFLLMLIVIIRSVTLPGAGAGLEFYLKPDFSRITPDVLVAALGQAFFSLSLGMGAMITYGSYLPKRENLVVAGAYVAGFDTGIALLAGFMIFPAVFAFGQDPAGGPALIFVILPEIFSAMPFGGIMAVIFFTLLSIAALTSTVSLLEVVVSYFVDERSWPRRRAVWIIGTVTFLVGIPSALSAGAAAGLTDMSWLVGASGFLGQTDFLSIMDAIWGNVALAFGALLISIFVGWVWGVKEASDEIRQGGAESPRTLRLWSFFIKYVCPIFILFVLLNIRQLIG